MDPVQQTLAQQQSGSAEGQGFGSFFTQGMQFGQAQQRLNIEKAQEVREQDKYNLVRPYIEDHARSEAALVGQNVQFNADKLRSQVELNNALPEIAQLEHAFMLAPDGFENQELRQQWLNLATKYPKAMIPPGTPGHDVWLQMQSPIVARQKFQQMLEQERQVRSQFPNLMLKLDDRTGSPVLAPLPDPSLSPVGKLQRDRDAALAGGNYESANELQKAIDKENTPRGAGDLDLLDRELAAFQRAYGRPPTDEEKQKITRMRMGLDPRAAAERPITEEHYINSHIDSFMQNPTAKSADGKLRILDRSEAIEHLRKEFQQLKRTPNGPAPSSGTTSALPEGHVWILSPPDASGKRKLGHIPSTQLQDALKQGYTNFEG